MIKEGVIKKHNMFTRRLWSNLIYLCLWGHRQYTSYFLACIQTHIIKTFGSNFQQHRALCFSLCEEVRGGSICVFWSWHSWLSSCLRHLHPIWVSVQVLNALSLIHLPRGVPEKAEEDDPSSWALDIHMRDTEEVPGSWLWCGTAPGVVTIWS